LIKARILPLNLEKQGMTPVQFKDARKALGLSQNAMAKSLGLKTSRAIRQYEAGERQVSGPVAKLIAMLLEQANGKDANPPEENK
jgi:DNA-binding transcriptional regulator YiaG